MRMTLLIGNIGSGKSTYTLAHMGKDMVVSLDGFRYMVGAGKYRFDVELEPLLGSLHSHMVFALMQRRKDIIVDETHMTKKSRKHCIDMAKWNGYEVHGWVFPRLGKKEAVDRRMSNPHDCPYEDIWKEVWERKDSQYEEPTKEEGFDNLLYVPRMEVGLNEEI